MTQKYDRFMAALEVLCKEHQVKLTPSGYDSIDVWDEESFERYEFVENFSDFTKAPKGTPKKEAPEDRAQRLAAHDKWFAEHLRGQGKSERNIAEALAAARAARGDREHESG